jgi:hypothetical protein
MSPAKPAGPQIRNSTRGRTGYTSSPAIPVAPDEVSLLSRLVSLLKSVRDVDSRVKRWIGCGSWSHRSRLSAKMEGISGHGIWRSALDAFVKRGKEIHRLIVGN